MVIKNLFANMPTDQAEEVTEVLTTIPGLRIERIVSRGHRSPDEFWYDQDEHEWVLLISGRARVQIEGETDLVELAAGDYLEIPAHLKHRLHWTDPEQDTVWLAVFRTDKPADKRGDV